MKNNKEVAPEPHCSTCTCFVPESNQEPGCGEAAVSNDSVGGATAGTSERPVEAPDNQANHSAEHEDCQRQYEDSYDEAKFFLQREFSTLNEQVAELQTSTIKAWRLMSGLFESFFVLEGIVDKRRRKMQECVNYGSVDFAKVIPKIDFPLFL